MTIYLNTDEIINGTVLTINTLESECLRFRFTHVAYSLVKTPWNYDIPFLEKKVLPWV